MQKAALEGKQVLVCHRFPETWMMITTMVLCMLSIKMCSSTLKVIKSIILLQPVDSGEFRVLPQLISLI